jgi:ABC-type bacteriocin/lantibiotic exporter with double-glycine peptidase domain
VTPLSPYRRLRQLLGADAGQLWLLALYAAFVGLLSLAIPIAVQQLVGTVAFGALLQPIFVLSALLLGGLAFSAVVRALESLVIERLRQRLFTRVALRYVSHLTHATSGACEPLPRDALLNRFFDVIGAHKALAILLADGLAVGLQTVIGVVALAFYHPWLFAFGVLLTGALGFVIFGLSRGALTTSLAESSAKYETVAWLEEAARHPAVFRGVGAAFAGQVAEAAVRRWIAEREARFAVRYRQHVGLLVVQVLALVGLLLVGGILVVTRQLALGQLIAAELIVSSLAVGIGKLGKSLEAAYDLATSAEKLAQVEEGLGPEPDGGAAPPPTGGGAEVSIRGLELRSEGQVVVRGDLLVRPGERVAIVGPAGCGKSALLDLLHGDWDGPAADGLVEIDGLDLRSWRRRTLRERLALVRSGDVFAGTIDDNVALGRPRVTAVEVQRALEEVGAWEFVARGREGLARPLRASGAPLSRGQALLLVLARALVGQPRLLLVDSLADLDGEGRRHVLGLLHDRARPHSVLLVAHDAALVGPCDRVYLLDRGALRLASSRELEVAA